MSGLWSKRYVRNLRNLQNCWNSKLKQHNDKRNMTEPKLNKKQVELEQKNGYYKGHSFEEWNISSHLEEKNK